MRTTYPRLAMLGAAPEAPGSIGAVIDAYRAHGLFKRWPIDCLAIRGGGGLPGDAARLARALKDLAILLARHHRMVVHLHARAQGFPRDALFMSAALAARCPLVLQLHGAGFERMPHAPLARYFLERAACVITPCESLRLWVRKLARNAHVLCVPPPLAFEPGPVPAARPNAILFLGRMHAAKGVFDLLEAVAALRPAVPDVRLVCAGQGERLAVARHAERLGIADAVRFTGQVGPSGKRALLEAAAAFALPSYDEAMPVSLLEAMSAGVPVVASPVGGIPEVVVDGVSGFLAAPGDTATLARLLRRLLLDRDLGARIGAAGRESARLRFAPERTLARLEDLYAALGLCEVPAPRPPALDLPRAA